MEKTLERILKETEFEMTVIENFIEDFEFMRWEIWGDLMYDPRFGHDPERLEEQFLKEEQKLIVQMEKEHKRLKRLKKYATFIRALIMSR